MIANLQPPPKNVDSLNLVHWVKDLLRWCFEVWRRISQPGLLLFPRTEVVGPASPTEESCGIKCTASSTVVLPAGTIGKVYIIDVLAGATVTVTGTNNQLIEGIATQTIYGDACMQVYFDGTGWRIQ